MRSKTTIFCALFSLIFSASVIAGTKISQSELPEAAREFIAKYFANDEIRKVEKDYEHNRVEYEVDFASGAEADFLADGQWKEVKAARGNSVPSEIVPDAISKYVAEKFGDISIVEISKLRGGYEVELSNGAELKLTNEGVPMQRRKGKRSR